MTDSKLAQIVQLEQSIHNLKMRWPIGIRLIDDEHDEKLKRLSETKRISMENEELGIEYEEWLDEVEATLPQPIPKEINYE